jgi:Dehydrogenases with different specificities (related to short-chain alcohol dehydrogenases)
MSAGRLSGKIALITGAAVGIGAEVAQKFSEEGAMVFVCDTNSAEGEKTAAAIGGVFIQLDVTKEESWTAAYATVMEQAKHLDILVNNAGINIRKNIEEMPMESFDAMMAVNVKGPFIGIKHALPIMRSGGGGVILNMSSVCGLIGHRFTNETYTTTKGALTLLTKSIAVRYAKDNIRCNSVHPSTVDTAFVQVMFQDPARKVERLGEVPLGRLATTVDVASCLVYLASDDAAFINGAAIPIDGGVTAA